MTAGMSARSGASINGMGGRSVGASSFHSAITDGQYHSFGGVRAAGSTLASGRFGGTGFNHAGFVGGNPAWRGGYGYGRYGYGYGRGWGYPGYGWGGWGWGWPYWGWDPYWNPYWSWSLYGY